MKRFITTYRTFLGALVFMFVCACGADSGVPAGAESFHDDDNNDPADDNPADDASNPDDPEQPCEGPDCETPVDDPTDDPTETEDPYEEEDPTAPIEDTDLTEEDLVDTDGDTIVDLHEGNCALDSDMDGMPDCRDLDSDDDRIPDSAEAGDADLTTFPIDTDGDGIYDFRDLDSDGDAIPDSIEGTANPDGDSSGNWIDRDSDGDTLGDHYEWTDDADEDGVPNYLDLDSDGDGIADWSEAYDDTDEDGTPDRFDSDSDNDGHSDEDEAGDSDIYTEPDDTDDDGEADFQDIDSDDDGLFDEFELGCPGWSDRQLADSDGDGDSDLAEFAVGSDACSASSNVLDEVEFFFFLPADGSQESAPLQFSTDLRQVDIQFNMDTTGSMSGEIAELRTKIQTVIIPGVEAALEAGGAVADVAFGVSEFRDFNTGGFGSSGDLAYRLFQRITTNGNDAKDGTDDLVHGGGADGPESGWEALYQIGTGDGFGSWIPDFASQVANSNYCGCPAEPGVADGTIGGAGFREGSLPIVVHFTDNYAHPTQYEEDHNSYVSGAHTYDDARDALRDIGARVIGVTSHSGARLELRDMAQATYAEVPLCAFDDITTCTGQCCTGSGGSGESSDGGMCPLVFTISGTGSGLTQSVVAGIAALAMGGTLEVTTEVLRDEDELSASGIDTSCFIEAVIPNNYDAPTGSCTSIPSIADLYAPSGVDDSFTNVTPGTTVYFDVFASNDGCAEPDVVPQAFMATINVIGDGVTILDTMEVTVIVPPEDVTGPKD